MCWGLHGYSTAGLQHQAYVDAQTIIEHIRKISNGDVVRMSQLSQFVLDGLHGQETVMKSRATQEREQDADLQVQTAIISGIKTWMDTMKSEFTDRYVNDIRAAQQAVASAIACELEHGQFRRAQRMTSLRREKLAAGHARFHAWLEGEVESLYDTRGAERSDRYPEEHRQWTHQFWLDECRASEKAKDGIRNPHDRSDKQYHRLHWCTESKKNLHAKCIEEGKLQFSKYAVTDTYNMYL